MLNHVPRWRLSWIEVGVNGHNFERYYAWTISAQDGLNWPSGSEGKIVTHISDGFRAEDFCIFIL